EADAGTSSDVAEIGDRTRTTVDIYSGAAAAAADQRRRGRARAVGDPAAGIQPESADRTGADNRAEIAYRAGCARYEYGVAASFDQRRGDGGAAVDDAATFGEVD